MATRIPLPGNGFEALQRGVEQGTSAFSQLLGQGIQRAQLEQQKAQQQALLALKQQEEMRAQQESPINMAYKQAIMNRMLKSQEPDSFANEKNRLNLELLRRKIESEQARAEKNRASGSSGIGSDAEQKRQMALQTFREKEEIKKELKGQADLTAPTKATITANQSVISAANNIIPQIEHLKKMDIPFAKTGAITSPDKYAKYEAQSNAIADGLMAAFGWPKTDQALQMAKQMVKRKPLESEDSYKTRLNEIISELKNRRAASNELLSSSKVKPKDQMIRGILNGKEMEIHPSKKNLFIKNGGELL